MNILVIPDSHASPRVSMRRFDWLGRFIFDTKPDVVVELGDWADNDSMSGYDRGKASFEGRRYKKDVEAAHEARDIVNIYVERMTKKPRLIALKGNHEDRSDRFADLHPEMVGKVSSDDFRPDGWEYHDFLKNVNVGGITFSHYFGTGVLGRPVSGEHPAHKLLHTQLRSCVMGHTHIWDICERTSGNRRIMCLVAGSYTDPRWTPSYAGPARKLWYDGLTILKDVANGYAPSVERVHISQLEKAYNAR